MTRINKVLKKLSELYEFNRKIKAYELKESADRSLKEDSAKERRTVKGTRLFSPDSSGSPQ